MPVDPDGAQVVHTRHVCTIYLLVQDVNYRAKEDVWETYFLDWLDANEPTWFSLSCHDLTRAERKRSFGDGYLVFCKLCVSYFQLLHVERICLAFITLAPKDIGIGTQDDCCFD